MSSCIIESRRQFVKTMPHVSTQPSHDTSTKSTPRHIASTSTSAKHQEIEVIADLYTTSLQKSTFQKLIPGIGMPNYSYAMLVVLI
ncbi:hypothetical protein ACFX1W_014047 [Malus domestica]